MVAGVAVVANSATTPQTNQALVADAKSHLAAAQSDLDDLDLSTPTVTLPGTTLTPPTSTTPTPTSTGFPAGFVTTSGTKFMLAGAQLRFIGENAYGMTGCQDGTPWTVAEDDAYFASLRPSSVTRTWAFRTQGTAGPVTAVKEAQKYGQKLIYALADGANYCGDTGHNAAFYQGGYKGAYFTWIRTVVPLMVRNPALMAWELMNEPRASGVSDAQMKVFFDDSAALIKSLDPNHLVLTGTLSTDEPGTGNYALIHSGPNIDGGSLHSYDYPYQNSRTIVSPHFAPAKSQLDSINKPIYVGEMGLSLAGDCNAQGRSDVLKAKADAYLKLGAQGVLGWGWSAHPANTCDPYSGTSDGPGSPMMAMMRGYTFP